MAAGGARPSPAQRTPGGPPAGSGHALGQDLHGHLPSPVSAHLQRPAAPSSRPPSPTPASPIIGVLAAGQGGRDHAKDRTGAIELGHAHKPVTRGHLHATLVAYARAYPTLQLFLTPLRSSAPLLRIEV